MTIKNTKNSGNMTESKLSDLKSKVRDSMSIDRQKLMMLQPFTGGVLMHFDMIPVRDIRVGTACTDGSRIYFDIDFYTRLSHKERVFVLAHECWHNIYLHFQRMGTRIPDLWNVATDCEINHMLTVQGFTMPPSLCYPEKEDEDKNAEQIYDKMLKNIKKHQKESGGDEEIQSAQGDSAHGNDSSSKESGKNGKNGKNGSENNKKHKSGDLEGQFDKHITQRDVEDDDIEVPSDKWGEKGFDDDFKPSISRDVAEKIREAVISEAQKIEKQQGTLPGSIQSIVDSYRKPEIPWREILCQEVTKCYSEHMSWLPPNRRFVHNGIYIPSRRGERLKVTVAVDTSGSCTSDIPKFLGELVSLLNSFSKYDLEFMECDASVQVHEKYDEYNQFPIDSLEDLKWRGFGGTSFEPVFRYIEENSEENPNLLIYLTDGYGYAPKDPPPYKVMWVVTKNGTTDFCDWGTKIQLTED